MNIFSDELKLNFFKDNFAKKYLHKPGIVDDYKNIMNLDILNKMLSIKNIWNNKNFLMALDRKSINFLDFSSHNLDMSGNI